MDAVIDGSTSSRSL